jgi:predicted RNA-binding Zn-ribbon protein involved in translation (DUF1610 family)
MLLELLLRLHDKTVHTCPVCLCNVNRVKVYRLKTCHHQFCKSCLRQWMHTRHYNCPICRQAMIERDRQALHNTLMSKLQRTPSF